LRIRKDFYPKAKLSKALLRGLGKTNVEYKLIGDGDRVLVGLSGGKDSLTLVHLLKNMQQNAPFRFEFKACTISYGMSGEDYKNLSEHCRTYGIPHTIYETKIYDISQKTIKENSSSCSYFSRMRRGALYSYASENGFNKIALGHHLDDAVESFFMNIFYNGTLRSMAPIYKSGRGFYVIRPLIEVRESQLRAFVESNLFDTIGDELCPAMRVKIKTPYAREKMKVWLKSMERENRNLFKMLKASFKHIHDDTFLDPKRWRI
jgi:tRNA(Ile)-lysidine synthetase-like protein